jgi:hypothetical protein
MGRDLSGRYLRMWRVDRKTAARAGGDATPSLERRRTAWAGMLVQARRTAHNMTQAEAPAPRNENWLVTIFLGRHMVSKQL